MQVIICILQSILQFLYIMHKILLTMGILGGMGALTV